MKISSEERTACDFCGNPKSQKFKFDLTGDRHIRVCASAECDSQFQLARLDFCARENRVPFEMIQDSVPTFLDPKKSWKVVRGSGEIEDGWKVARNWRVSTEYGMLSTLRGEPWYRIPLVKDDKVRLCLITELREHNEDVLALDVWDMLQNDILPKQPEEPTDAFLDMYSAKAWTMKPVTEEKLKEMRL